MHSQEGQTDLKGFMIMPSIGASFRLSSVNLYGCPPLSALCEMWAVGITPCGIGWGNPPINVE